MKYFKKPTDFVAAILLIAVLSFSTVANTSPVVVYDSEGLAIGINDIEITGFGTYDVTFRGYWVTYNSGVTIDGGELYTYDFAYAASSSLFDLLNGGSLQGSDLDFNSLAAVGCTSGGGCTMHTPWDYVQLGDFSALLHSQFVDNIYAVGQDTDSWTDGFNYSAVGSAGPGYSDFPEDYSPVTWSLDSSLYLTWTEAPSPDSDEDGVPNELDNCTNVANSLQLDTDNDGYGNACDADFNNDCIINFLDIASFSNEFLGNNPLFDINGDGNVNFLDFSFVSQQFLQEPGPGQGSCP